MGRDHSTLHRESSLGLDSDIAQNITCFTMVMKIDVSPEKVKKLEKFLCTGEYKKMATSLQSFSRKLNEERKMRGPYIDSQTGVAQKHYPRHTAQERMPGMVEGQVYSYPQKRWYKKKYQYLQPLLPVAPKPAAKGSGYCDFCLGDGVHNKKTGT